MEHKDAYAPWCMPETFLFFLPQCTRQEAIEHQVMLQSLNNYMSKIKSKKIGLISHDVPLYCQQCKAYTTIREQKC